LPPHLHRYADHARFFLHVLYAQRVFKDGKEEFVSLKAAYMRRVFPDNTVYKQVRDTLLASETIVCDGICYQADRPMWRNLDDRHRGGKCYGYKLGPRWVGVSYERVALTTRALLKSIAKVNQARQTEIVTLPHRHIWRCLQGITIDHAAAVQELDEPVVEDSPRLVPDRVEEAAVGRRGDRLSVDQERADLDDMPGSFIRVGIGRIAADFHGRRRDQEATHAIGSPAIRHHRTGCLQWLPKTGAIGHTTPEAATELRERAP
jgi:hypothetical protein